MIRNILLGYDGSESADRALEFAASLAHAFTANLHVLAAARAPEHGGDVETQAIVEHSRLRCDQVLRAARARLEGAGVNTQFQIVIGNPAEEIVRYAEQMQTDHIVVGHGEHTLLDHWLIGSVAGQVIAHAPCAVTVVRERSP